MQNLRCRECVPAAGCPSHRWSLRSGREIRRSPPIYDGASQTTGSSSAPCGSNRSGQMSFLPPPAIRQLISVPTQDRVDFRAACFCHKRIVEIGFVCSVCLSSKLALCTARQTLGSLISPPSLLSTCACLLDMSVSETDPSHNIPLLSFPQGLDQSSTYSRCFSPVGF